MSAASLGSVPIAFKGTASHHQLLGDVFVNIPPTLGGAYTPTLGRNVTISVAPTSVAGTAMVVPPPPGIIAILNEGGGTGLVFDQVVSNVAYLRTLGPDPSPALSGIAISTDTAGAVVNIGNSLQGFNLGAGIGVFQNKNTTGQFIFGNLAGANNIVISAPVGGVITISDTSASAVSQVWTYVVDVGTVPSSVVLNPAFPGSVIPSNLVFPDVSTEANPPPYGGVTLIFDVSSGAFRSGQVNDGQWTQANRGAQSVAFGLNTTASGAQSFALGIGCVASGAQCLAAGSGGVVAAGTASIAMGLNAVTLTGSVGSVALGQGCTAGGNQCFAAGFQNSAEGQTNSILAGQTNTAPQGTGWSSILCGTNNAIASNNSSVISGGGISATQANTTYAMRWTYYGGVQAKSALATAGTYNASLDDYVVLLNTNSNSVNVNLPQANGNGAPLVSGQTYWFRSTSNVNSATVTGFGGGGGALLYPFGATTGVNAVSLTAANGIVLMFVPSSSGGPGPAWLQIA